MPGGAPSAVVGTLLIVMAFGLLARSRLAWAISIIAAIGRDQRPGRVLIAGSLYLADVVLRQDAEE